MPIKITKRGRAVMISTGAKPLAWYKKRFGEAGEYAHSRRLSGKSIPWTKAAVNIFARCNIPTTNRYERYGGRGIKCLITENDLLELFIRDRAWRLKQPSVDRIDNDGHYNIGNLRWIEMRENAARARRKRK